ncbi:uncharacterized protein [Amphiura filiformis]|uniref:uncharacterized protein n=1 Tax=Amphiura filiformis TaxID=82378 RepID=UPI003B2249FC
MNFKHLQFRVEKMADKHTDGHAECNCGCWKWTGMNPNGRCGTMFVAGKRMNAHRVSYMAFNKCIDLPRNVYHLCRRPWCVNPSHLSHEEIEIYVDRKTCKQRGHCTNNHKMNGKVYKNCIFTKVCKQGFVGYANMNFEHLQFRVETMADKHTDGHAECNCGCWKWTGMNPNGRCGTMFVAGKRMNAHRVSYMAFNKCIDLPHNVYHLCGRPWCVNPSHLSHEEYEISLGRETCKQRGHCTDNHKSVDGKVYKNCIFTKVCKQVNTRTRPTTEDHIPMPQTQPLRPKRRWNGLLPPKCRYCHRWFGSTSGYLSHKRHHELNIKPYWYKNKCKLFNHLSEKKVNEVTQRRPQGRKNTHMYCYQGRSCHPLRPKRCQNGLLPPKCKYCHRWFGSTSRYLFHKHHHELNIKPYWYRNKCKLFCHLSEKVNEVTQRRKTRHVYCYQGRSCHQQFDKRLHGFTNMSHPVKSNYFKDVKDSHISGYLDSESMMQHHLVLCLENQAAVISQPSPTKKLKPQATNTTNPVKLGNLDSKSMQHQVHCVENQAISISQSPAARNSDKLSAYLPRLTEHCDSQTRDPSLDSHSRKTNTRVQSLPAHSHKTTPQDSQTRDSSPESHSHKTNTRVQSLPTHSHKTTPQVTVYRQVIEGIPYYMYEGVSKSF